MTEPVLEDYYQPPRYWDENLYRRTFDAAFELGQLAVNVEDDIKSGVYGDDKETRRDLSRLGDAALDLSAVLFSKMPSTQFEKFDRERRQSTARESGHARRLPVDSIPARIASFLRAHSGQRITLDYVVQELFPDASNRTAVNYRKKQITNALYDGHVQERLDKTGLVLHRIARRNKAHLMILNAGEDPKWSFDDGFWSGQEGLSRPDFKYGEISDWVATTLAYFQGRALSIKDVSKVIYAEQFDTAPMAVRNRIHTRFQNGQAKEGIKKRLAMAGMILVDFDIKAPGERRKRKIYTCVPSRDELPLPEELSEPTDEELRELAIKLRAGELPLLTLQKDKQENFLNGRVIEYRPSMRNGMLADWVAAAFEHFQGRPLTHDDIAKVLFAESYDSDSKKARARVIGLITSRQGKKSLSRRLSSRGYEIKKIAHDQSGKSEVRLICVPAGKDLNSMAINEGQRPTDNELFDLAADLRQEEAARQKEAGIDHDHRRIQREINAAWAIHDQLEKQREQDIEREARAQINKWYIQQGVPQVESPQSSANETVPSLTERFGQLDATAVNGETEDDDAYSPLERYLIAGVLVRTPNIQYHPHVQIVLRSLANGMSAKMIAAAIKSSESTVDEILSLARRQHRDFMLEAMKPKIT